MACVNGRAVFIAQGPKSKVTSYLSSERTFTAWKPRAEKKKMKDYKMHNVRKGRQIYRQCMWLALQATMFKTVPRQMLFFPRRVCSYSMYHKKRKKGCPCDHCKKTCHFILMLHFAGVITLAESNDSRHIARAKLCTTHVNASVRIVSGGATLR